MNTRHWAMLGETTFVGGVWLLYAVHRLLGRAFFRGLMLPVALVHWLTRPALRAASLQYLQRLHVAQPGLFTRAPGWREGLRHVALFAETLLDKLLAIAGRYPFERVREQGLEHLQRARAQGRGGLFVTAHMGCLELCRVMGQRKAQLDVTVLVHTRHAQAFNRILQRLDPQTRVRLLEVSDFGPATAVQLAAIVDAGGWVAIAGDRVPLNSQQVAQVDFLGHSAPLPVGPYVLASLLRCPLLLLACVHAGDGYVIHFDTLAERVQLPRAERQAALAQHAQAFADALAILLRTAPYDWFNFYAFWDHADAPA
ncbi:putative LPLAT superfamily acyltransferase [Inhella inkyongensis]|uniref:Putative LPLAT superfamily acyltransferase n=1 Tax=Inhella inkyongensis TaxID=392593 RepID=A0A840S7W3_9BURK|nr:putative LPLAT superfamily acyltransferase [Inhella inkyongensis]